MEIEHEQKEEGDIFTIKRFNAVTTWRYNIESNVCAICKSDITGPCITCQNDKQPGKQDGFMLSFSLLF